MSLMAIALIVSAFVSPRLVWSRNNGPELIDPLPILDDSENCTLPTGFGGDIVFPNGTEVLSLTNNTVMPIQTVILIKCWPGLNLQGDEISVCITADHWWPPLGSCVIDVKEEVWRFHSATLNGDISIVQEMLERQVTSTADRRFLLDHRNPEGGGRTVLSEAAMGGYLHLVRYFDKFQVDYRTRDDDRGSMPIHLAAEQGYVEIVAFLLERAPDLLEMRNKAFNTPLCLAAAEGRLAVVQFLVENKSSNVETRCEAGHTLLMRAVINGQRDVVKYLIENGNASILSVDNERIRNTALHVAAETGQIAILDYFLSLNSSLVMLRNGVNDTVVNRAALRCQADTLKYLLTNQTAEVDNQGNMGRTPLLQSLAISNLPSAMTIRTMKELLEHGADAFARDAGTGATVAHLAVESNRSEVLRFLLDSHPALVEAVNANNETILIRASMSGDLQMVQFLVENRSANLETRGNLARTPLLYAASRGELGVVKYLVNMNASVTAVDQPRGNMAHHLAAAFGHLPVVKFLLDVFPDLLEAKSFIGDTAMNQAASGGHVHIMTYLMEVKNAIVENRGYRGTTPFLRAAGNGRLLAVQFLLERGANPNVTTDFEFGAENAMHMAATYNHLPVARFLKVKCPWLFSAKNTFGQTPLDVAVKSGASDVMKLILQTLGQSQPSVTTSKPVDATSSTTLPKTTFNSSTSKSTIASASTAKSSTTTTTIIASLTTTTAPKTTVRITTRPILTRATIKRTG